MDQHAQGTFYGGGATEMDLEDSEKEGQCLIWGKR